jgi:hypothetical protein
MFEPTKFSPEGPEPGVRLARLEILENGRPKAYDVDPYVAKAFEKLTPAEVSVVAKVIAWPFNNVIYPLIIKYNPGFQLAFNPVRDFRRSWKNAGAVSGVPLGQLARNYVKAFRSAKGFVGGKLDPLAREMLESYAIATPMESMNYLDRVTRGGTRAHYENGDGGAGCDRLRGQYF